jgi:hypothetical protein
MAFRTIGYFENWAQYRQAGGKFFPNQIDPNLFTHINFAFALFGFITWSVDPNPARTGPQRLTGDYTVQPTEWNDETALYPALNALKQQNPNLKTLLSIGGWSMNSGTDVPTPGNPHPYGHTRISCSAGWSLIQTDARSSSIPQSRLPRSTDSMALTSTGNTRAIPPEAALPMT